jgi:hypothetical protein
MIRIPRHCHTSEPRNNLLYGDYTRVPELVADLVRSKVEVITRHSMTTLRPWT